MRPSDKRGLALFCSNHPRAVAWFAVIVIAAAIALRETSKRPLYVAPSNAWGATWRSYAGWPLTAMHVYDLERYPDGLGGAGQITHEYQYKVVPIGAVADASVAIWLVAATYVSIRLWSPHCRGVQFSLRSLFSIIAVIAIFVQVKRLEPLVQDAFARFDTDARYHVLDGFLGPEPIRFFDPPIWFAACCAIYATVHLVLRAFAWCGRKLLSSPRR